MRRIRLLAWTICAVLVLGSVAWAQTSGRTAEQDDVFWESVSGCMSAVDFAADRLTTGVGGTAVGCYPEVQSLDPANMVAVEGLQRVFDKYAAWARAALEKGDAGKARGHVEKLKGLAPEAPEVAELESGIARLEKEAEEKRERAEAERKERKRAALAPDRVFRDCDACPEMVVVPAGSFMMGSPSHEEGRYSGEGPQHRVTIPAPFAVGKHEVAFDEWDACVAAGGCGGHHLDDEGWGRRPVIDVNWDNAKAYVRWLSRRTGKSYRLLSEAEWEYAARAGTTGPFHTGSTISTNQANYTYGAGREGLYREKTVPVGSFPANGFGLHDVHGNVWEWVEDYWHSSYRGASVGGSARTSGGDCGKRVLRGGSWNNEPGNLRSAFRHGNPAGDRSFSIGFRVARTLTP